MTERLRWGIMGTGNIANQFAQGLSASHRGILIAAASRTQAAASAFIDKHNAKASALEGYDRLLDRTDVDAIYLALPNHMHMDWTLKALQAGKHVLCEKPIANNAQQAAVMFEQAKQSGKILVEAFMYRSHPLHHAIMQQIQEGAIGNIQAIRTSFCFKVANTQGNIRFSRACAGGALMDIGCYCVNFSRHYTQSEPIAVQAIAKRNDDGVDILTTGNLHFPGDVLASFTCGMTLHADNAAYICGDEGYITIPIPWKPPVQQAVYMLNRGTPPRMDQGRGAVTAGPMRKEVHIDADRPLYALEADDFATVVMDGTTPTISPADTLANMHVLDELRACVGVHFDDEGKQP
jgi:predicted dehydrogenase